MLLRLLLVLLCESVVYCDALYPVDSLINEGNLYNFGGDLPLPRVHHTLAYVKPYVIVHGGVSAQENYLDDLHMYDVRFQTWTGALTRLECCNGALKVVDRLGTYTDGSVFDLQIGFEGGVPAARAEHASTGVDDLMYMFGGVSEFGLMNDFFMFDPSMLKWASVTQVASSWPSRRAGHSLHSLDGRIFLFGGRAESSHSGVTVSSVNDVWIFDIRLHTWTLANTRSSSLPSGRQHFASAIYARHLWVFGGMDHNSHITYNDMWSFHLDTFTWEQRSANSGSLSGFLPPPLHHAHLVPTQRGDGLLVYGGIGSGGACGGPKCKASQTVMGQLYRYDITTDEWFPGRLETDSARNTELATDAISSGEWQFARVSSDHSGDTGGSGKFTKSIVLEQIAFADDRHLLFEFGGVEFSVHTNSTNSSKWEPIVPQVADGGEREGQSSIFYEAGGVLANDPWDLYTGEQLRETVDIPVASKWWYTNFPAAANATDVSFRRIFRQYTVDTSDIVLLDTTSIAY